MKFENIADDRNLKRRPHFYCFIVPPQIFNSAQHFSFFCHKPFVYMFYLGFFFSSCLSVCLCISLVQWRSEEIPSYECGSILPPYHLSVSCCLSFISKVSGGPKAGQSIRRAHLMPIQSDGFSVCSFL